MGIRLLISAQGVISRFLGLSPTLGSALTTKSLLGIAPPPLTFPLSENKYIYKKRKEKKGSWLLFQLQCKYYGYSSPNRRRCPQGSVARDGLHVLNKTLYFLNQQDFYLISFLCFLLDKRVSTCKAHDCCESSGKADRGMGA